jgi:chondroitin 4-sulfotransferase 11
MPVSHRHKAIFVHIPKTAGTSIEAVLGMHGDKQDIGVVPYFNQEVDHEHLYGRQMQHMTAQSIRSVLEDDAAFDAYFKFTVVRNPWDRLVSALAWTGQKWARGELLTQLDFEQQVQQAYELFNVARSASGAPELPHFLYPQCLYVYDAQRRPLVDFVARYENLEADWRAICQKLGVDAPLPQRMRSHHKVYRDYYSPRTRDLEAEMYAADAEIFDYDF